MLASGAAPEKHGTILLATVEGDIHDIGKNIVKVMLDNYGFDVIDLGKNVPCERVVDEAERLDCRLVGLSALMTTTVPAMERTIRLLRERGLDCRGYGRRRGAHAGICGRNWRGFLREGRHGERALCAAAVFRVSAG